MKSLEHLEVVRNMDCCLCGQGASPHHMKAIGMGRNRKNEMREHYMTIPLCVKHHTEWHAMGNRAFNVKYQVDMWMITANIMADILYDNQP